MTKGLKTLSPLIKLKMGELEQTAQRLAGEFDIVVRVQVKTLDKLLKVTNKIQMIPGVKKTNTQVIEKEIAL